MGELELRLRGQEEGGQPLGQEALVRGILCHQHFRYPANFRHLCTQKLESFVRSILYYKHLSNPANYCHLCTKKRGILWLQNLNNPANSHHLFNKKRRV